MSAYKITIPITPRAKASVRLGRKGTYNPSARGMSQLKAYVLQNYPTMKILKGPLLVIAHFAFPAPLTFSKPKRLALNLTPHTKRPDGDNLEKFVNDALTGVCWVDDCQIAWMVRTKSITINKTGHTTIFVTELQNPQPDYDEILTAIKENITLEVPNANN